MDQRELVNFFEPGNIYAKPVPGTNVKLLFDCQAVMRHRDSGQRYASGFQCYEGSGFWRKDAITFRDFDAWELYESGKKEEFFEPGFTYELHLEGGHVGAEFRCIGVGDDLQGKLHAMGYLRFLKISGHITPWELEVKYKLRNGPNVWVKTEKE